MRHLRPRVGLAAVKIWGVLGVVGVLLLGVSIPRVDAGIGASDTPTWPSPVTVGTIFNASVIIVNQSTLPNETENVLMTALFVTPACADSGSPICLLGSTDPGVFDVLTAVGDASTTPCAGVAFAVGPPDITTGEVQLTPPAPGIILGPANGAAAARTCQVNLSLRVKKLPANPVTPGTGITDPLTRATLQGQSSQLGGTASGSAQTTVQPGNPTVQTTSQPNTGGLPQGTSVSDTATVSGAAGAATPTGTVTFFLCQPAQVTAGGCASPAGAQVGAVKTLDASGQATSDSTTNTNTPGPYCWRAEYSGDTNYNPASHTDATQECFSITQPPLEFNTQPLPGSGTVLQTSLSDTATISGGNNPTGTITFNLYAPGDTQCTASIFTSVVPVNGPGTYNSGPFPANQVTQTGVYNWTAQYSGDANNDPAFSGCGSEPVQISPALVPTLSEWGMLLFVMLLVGIGSVTLMRRRNVTAG